MKNIIKRMRIGLQLWLGFIVVFIFTAVISVIAVFSLFNAREDYNYSIEYPSERLLIMEDARVNMEVIRRLVTMAILQYDNPEILREIIEEFEESFSNIVQNFESFSESLENDPVMDEEVRLEKIEQTERVQQRIEFYIIRVLRSVLSNVQAGRNEAALNAITEARIVEDQMNALYQDLFVMTQEYMNELSLEMERSMRAQFLRIIFISVTGLLASIAWSWFVIKNIKSPITRFSSVLSQVADGDLNVQLKSSTNDRNEIIRLEVALYNVVSTFRGITEELKFFMHEVAANGDIDYLADATKFKGEYAIILHQVNDFKKIFVDDILSIIHTLNSINQGNFSTELKKLAGKKVILNETKDELQNKLLNIRDDLNSMITAISERGDLSFRINADKYSGDWALLAQGLNQVADSCDKPLTEIRHAMNKLSEGHFNARVTGNYSGDFNFLKRSVNNTIDELSKYVKELSEKLALMSAGDMSARIDAEYLGDFAEIKNSINKIGEQLGSILGEIFTSLQDAIESASNISDSITNLATSSDAQTLSISDLNKFIGTIAEQTQNTAESANQAMDISRRSMTNAADGDVTTLKMLEIMKEIKTSSFDIADVIKTIKDIAFQTNLLALNASVEATRAGEHGKGFTVVAEEVRSLAENSRKSSEETETQIDKSIKQVKQGSMIAEETADLLKIIVKNAEEIFETLESITNASNEQAKAAKKASVGLKEISNAVSDNNKIASETAAEAQNLNAQAQELRRLVSRFKF